MAFAVAVPLLGAVLVGVAIDRQMGTAPWGVLVATLVGLVLAGGLVFVLVSRYLTENPPGPVTDAAREAGRRWDREIREAEAERERRREAGED